MIDLDLSLENLYRQYYLCRRNKRNTVNALRFEANQEKNLIGLQEALLDRTYRPSRSVCFFATKPKLREIFAADFRDRVVHHLLVDYLEKIWEPIFIHDSYACRTGKGVHAGVQRLQTFIRQVARNGTQPAWYLQLDVRNYFMRIDKDILFGLLERKLKGDTARWLTRLLVFHDCTADYIMRGNPKLLDVLPSHKSLIGGDACKGLPIGNLNSQFFANVYLNELDQFVKHELKCRHYVRYCDDFILLANNVETLRDWQVRIETRLRENLALELHPVQRLAPVSNGVDFLGYIVRRDYLLVRRRVVNNLKSKLRAYRALLVDEQDGVRCYRFDEHLLDELAAVVSSYLGHLKMANSWRLVQSLWQRFDFLAQYFDFDAQHWRLVRKYKVPAGLNTVRRQYRHFRWRFPNDVLLFRVGKFYEFYDVGPSPGVAHLELKRMRWNRRGARHGFPAHYLQQNLARLLSMNTTILLIEERPSATGGVRRRLPQYRFCTCVE